LRLQHVNTGRRMDGGPGMSANTPQPIRPGEFSVEPLQR